MGTMIHRVASDTHSPIRARHGLSQVQAICALAGLVSLASSWTIKRQESYDGHLFLIVARASDDATLLVDRDAKGIQVDLMIGDEFHSSDVRYSSVDTAVRAIEAIAGDTRASVEWEAAVRHCQNR